MRLLSAGTVTGLFMSGGMFAVLVALSWLSLPLGNKEEMPMGDKIRYCVFTPLVAVLTNIFTAENAIPA